MGKNRERDWGGGGGGRAGGWRVCEISARLPMNNGAMKTVEYI